MIDSADVFFTEICEDIRDECSKYGPVEDLKIPRPSGGSRMSNGVGKIYIKFDTVETAAKALRALAGRKFADRTVVSTYFGEVSQTRTLLCLRANSITARIRRQRVVKVPSGFQKHEFIKEYHCMIHQRLIVINSWSCCASALCSPKFQASDLPRTKSPMDITKPCSKLINSLQGIGGLCDASGVCARLTECT